MCKGIIIFIIIFLSGWVQQPLYANPLSSNKMELIVKSSPDSQFQTRLTIQAYQMLEHISKKRVRRKTENFPVTDTYLTIEANGSTKVYLVDQQGAALIDQQAGETIELPEVTKDKLSGYVDQLRAIHYGKMISWDKAKHIISKKTIFQVTDLETGLHFNVQRRAGKNHADVQPLTKEDTAIMKQIYRGKWSWKRKAILVQKESQYFAASMHGMPHGGDGIPGNKFSGHFCIHFMGSATHGSGSVDPEHQVMIYKAAGKLNEYFANASPYEVIDSFMIALHLQEPQLLKMSFSHGEHQQLHYFLSDMQKIRGIRKITEFDKIDTSGFIFLEIPLEVSIHRIGQKEEKASYIFRMKKDSLLGSWKIDFITQIS